MAISKDKKKKILDKLNDIVGKASTVVFVNFHGLPVEEANQLRRSLAEDGVGYLVAKKTLISKSLSGIKVSGDQPELKGEIAVAYGEDLLAPVKGVYDFSKKAEQLEIVGGIFDGEYKDQETMMSLAKIPSQQVLYGQLANVINSPIQGLVIALNGIAEARN